MIIIRNARKVGKYRFFTSAAHHPARGCLTNFIFFILFTPLSCLRNSRAVCVRAVRACPSQGEPPLHHAEHSGRPRGSIDHSPASANLIDLPPKGGRPYADVIFFLYFSSLFSFNLEHRIPRGDILLL